MKENSIEEDIKDIEKYISFTSKRENFSHDTDWNWNKDLANKIEHILSSYKKVLKENKELNEKWDKDTHKLQNDLDIANAKIIELLKENEELKILKSGIQTLQNLGIEDGKYIVMSKTDFLNGSCKHLLDDYIPVQKVKDILNEINKEYIKQEEIFNKYFEKENRDMEAYYIQKEATGIMQELSWVEGKSQELLEGKGE